MAPMGIFNVSSIMLYDKDMFTYVFKFEHCITYITLGFVLHKLTFHDLRMFCWKQQDPTHLMWVS